MAHKFFQRLRCATALFIVLSISQPINTHAGPAPAVAGFASIIPGLGQTIQGHWFEGILWAGASALYFSPQPDLSNAGFNLYMYQMYDAYRDAGAPGAAKHSVYENYLANINPLNLVDLVGAPTVGFAAGYNYYVGAGYPVLKNPIYMVDYGFVGLGEEAFFRGFFFHGVSRLFHSAIVGAIVSSTGFAYAHVIGGTQNLQLNPLLQRFSFGMIMCLMLYRNNYDLRHNIFTHSWYDIFIDTGTNKINAEVRWTIPLL